MGCCAGGCYKAHVGGEDGEEEPPGLRELVVLARRRRKQAESAGGGQAPANKENDACCLKWAVSTYDQGHSDDEQLLALHYVIGNCITYFGSEIIEDDVVSGIVRGHPLETGSMSAADTLVRLGQILCRWASAQYPPFGLQIGVHVGRLEVMSLPNSDGRQAHFGIACAMASRLAQASEKAVVHLSGRARDHLSALRLLRMTVSPTFPDAYYLAPETAVVRDGPNDSSRPVGRLDVRELAANLPGSVPNRARISFAEFSAILEGYGIDTWKFGRGGAQPLQQFYDAVVQEGKCYLTVRGDRLERVVELVRISIRIGDRNRQQELRLLSEKYAEGLKPVLRNRPLALVLQPTDKGGWQSGLEAFLQAKFELSLQAQKACLLHEDDEYTLTEAASETVPGIMTIYKTKEVVVKVSEENHKELSKIGLPSGDNFTTKHGQGQQEWTWAPVVEVRATKEIELMTLLERSGVDISDFSWQAFQDLYDEVYETNTCHLEEMNGTLMRIVSIVKVWLHVDIFNLDHVLVLQSKKKSTGTANTSKRLRVLTMRMKESQEWKRIVEELLTSRLGIAADVQQKHLAMDLSSHRQLEEVDLSNAMPGLKSLTRIHEVSVRILDANNPHWRYMGLPNGCDFSVSRKGLKKSTEMDDFVITRWGWQNQDDVLLRECVQQQREGATPSLADVFGSKQDALVTNPVAAAPIVEQGSSPKGRISEEAVTPLGHETLSQLVAALGKTSPGVEAPVLQLGDEDELLLSRLMLGTKTDWSKARNAAEKMLDEEYTTRLFYEDVCKAFPELGLYCIRRDGMERAPLGGVTKRKTNAHVEEELHTGSSGDDDDFQRAIGSLFSVFWLLRMNLDGKECFCFGLDRDWNPRSASAWDLDNPEEEDEYKKRVSFYEATDWEALQQLLEGAGILKESGGHDPDRTLTILVMVTLHNIMKLDMLLPTVSAPFAGFGGYKAGELILDQDVALSYVLEHHPTVLPTFSGLSKAQQDTIKFMHSKLEYNMCLLVQAEAPPGAIFSAFRKVIISGKVPNGDVALYLLHWFADLAGAEPSPLRGCEKFVVKFPQRSLQKFVDTFPLVWNLGNQTETQVYEDYMQWYWKNHNPPLGDLPEKKGSIAQMRLVLMSQGNSTEILRHFADLPSDDCNVLREELAMTGCKELFGGDDLKDCPGAGKGPAISVYYSPTLLQRAGRTDPRGALMVLAEVFRQARELWPYSTKPEDVMKTVIVRIDALKDLEVDGIRRPRPGLGFVLEKKSSIDGHVKLLPITSFSNLDWAFNQVLTFTDGREKIAAAGRKLRGTSLLHG